MILFECGLCDIRFKVDETEFDGLPYCPKCKTRSHITKIKADDSIQSWLR